jgi:hypothetical protein
MQACFIVDLVDEPQKIDGNGRDDAPVAHSRHHQTPAIPICTESQRADSFAENVPPSLSGAARRRSCVHKRRCRIGSVERSPQSPRLCLAMEGQPTCDRIGCGCGVIVVGRLGTKQMLAAGFAVVRSDLLLGEFGLQSIRRARVRAWRPRLMTLRASSLRRIDCLRTIAMCTENAQEPILSAILRTALTSSGPRSAATPA